MEPRKNCDNCLHERKLCDPRFDQAPCMYWKPGHTYWKQKFQKRTRGGRCWAITEQFNDRLYGRLREDGSWRAFCWGLDGSNYTSCAFQYNLLPREPDIYNTPEWEKFKEIVGIETKEQSLKQVCNFKDFYDAFRLKQGDDENGC